MNTTFGDGSRKLRLYWLSARRQLLALVSPWATPIQAPSASPFARSRAKHPFSFAEISRDRTTRETCEGPGAQAHGLVGNSWARVGDSFHPDCHGAPTNGSTWIGGCEAAGLVPIAPLSEPKVSNYLISRQAGCYCDRPTPSGPIEEHPRSAMRAKIMSHCGPTPTSYSKGFNSDASSSILRNSRRSGLSFDTSGRHPN